MSALEQLDAWLGPAPDEYAIVLGPDGRPRGRASRCADALRDHPPAISVILVRRSVDTDVLAAAHAAGMPRGRRGATT